METVSDKVKEVVKQKECDSREIKHLNCISDRYRRLIDAGLTTVRGYNLMTITDVPKIKYYINHK